MVQHAVDMEVTNASKVISGVERVTSTSVDLRISG